MLDESTPTGFAHFDWLCSAFVSTGFTLMSSIRVARPDIMQATSSGPGRDTRREKRALAVPRLLGCSAGVSGLFATAVFDPTQWSLCVCVCTCFWTCLPAQGPSRRVLQNTGGSLPSRGRMSGLSGPTGGFRWGFWEFVAEVLEVLEMRLSRTAARRPDSSDDQRFELKRSLRRKDEIQ